MDQTLSLDKQPETVPPPEMAKVEEPFTTDERETSMDIANIVKMNQPRKKNYGNIALGKLLLRSIYTFNLRQISFPEEQFELFGRFKNIQVFTSNDQAAISDLNFTSERKCISETFSRSVIATCVYDFSEFFQQRWLLHKITFVGKINDTMMLCASMYSFNKWSQRILSYLGSSLKFAPEIYAVKTSKNVTDVINEYVVSEPLRSITHQPKIISTANFSETVLRSFYFTLLQDPYVYKLLYVIEHFQYADVKPISRTRTEFISEPYLKNYLSLFGLAQRTNYLAYSDLYAYRLLSLYVYHKHKDYDNDAIIKDIYNVSIVNALFLIEQPQRLAVLRSSSARLFSDSFLLKACNELQLSQANKEKIIMNLEIHNRLGRYKSDFIPKILEASGLSKLTESLVRKYNAYLDRITSDVIESARPTCPHVSIAIQCIDNIPILHMHNLKRLRDAYEELRDYYSAPQFDLSKHVKLSKELDAVDPIALADMQSSFPGLSPLVCPKCKKQVLCLHHALYYEILLYIVKQVNALKADKRTKTKIITALLSADSILPLVAKVFGQQDQTCKLCAQTILSRESELVIVPPLKSRMSEDEIELLKHKIIHVIRIYGSVDESLQRGLVELAIEACAPLVLIALSKVRHLMGRISANKREESGSAKYKSLFEHYAEISAGAFVYVISRKKSATGRIHFKRGEFVAKEIRNPTEAKIMAQFYDLLSDTHIPLGTIREKVESFKLVRFIELYPVTEFVSRFCSMHKQHLDPNKLQFRNNNLYTGFLDSLNMSIQVEDLDVARVIKFFNNLIIKDDMSVMRSYKTAHQNIDYIQVKSGQKSGAAKTVRVQTGFKVEQSLREILSQLATVTFPLVFLKLTGLIEVKDEELLNYLAKLRLFILTLSLKKPYSLLKDTSYPGFRRVSTKITDIYGTNGEPHAWTHLIVKVGGKEVIKTIGEYYQNPEGTIVDMWSPKTETRRSQKKYDKKTIDAVLGALDWKMRVQNAQNILTYMCPERVSQLDADHELKNGTCELCKLPVGEMSHFFETKHGKDYLTKYGDFFENRVKVILPQIIKPRPLESAEFVDKVDAAKDKQNIRAIISEFKLHPMFIEHIGCCQHIPSEGISKEDIALMDERKKDISTSEYLLSLFISLSVAKQHFDHINSVTEKFHKLKLTSLTNARKSKVLDFSNVYFFLRSIILQDLANTENKPPHSDFVNIIIRSQHNLTKGRVDVYIKNIEDTEATMESGQTRLDKDGNVKEDPNLDREKAFEDDEEHYANENED